MHRYSASNSDTKVACECQTCLDLSAQRIAQLEARLLELGSRIQQTGAKYAKLHAFSWEYPQAEPIPSTARRELEDEVEGMETTKQARARHSPFTNPSLAVLGDVHTRFAVVHA